MRASSPCSHYGLVSLHTLRQRALVLIGIALLLAASPSSAAVTIDWVPIRHPGNPADAPPSNCFTGTCGSVAYSYYISKYEVTNAQYAEFLNAVDSGGANTLGLYNTSMNSDAISGGISFISGNPSGSKYVVKSGFANKPVVYVSFYDSLRFANWLSNSQGSAGTETGAYTLLGGTPTPSNGLTVTRNALANTFLTSENEWYKAAYYSPGGVYFDNPVGTDTSTVCAAPTATANRANCNSAVGALTDVGAYTESSSPYGTYDQGGNAFEWNEQIVGSNRGLRGGSWYWPASSLEASSPLNDPAAGEYDNVGFRVASLVGSTQVAKPVAGDAAAGDQFGAASSISGDTIVVGAQRDDDAGSESGSAYVFERNVGGEDDWGQVKKLTAADAAAGDLFGAAVSISVDTVVVGAYLDDDAGESSGSVYVFERNAGGADNWGQVKKLTAADAAAGDQFGVSVSISGDTIVVGAHVEDSVAPDSGSVYVFERNEGGADNWGEVKKLIASDAATDDLFGFSVSISGDTVVVGAFAEDSVAADSGSAYVFERNEGGADNWGQVKKLIASDAGAGDFFGAAVSISGDAVVVGANSNDDAGADSGSAYVFERNAGGEDNWGEVQELTASDAGGGGFFGISVSISVDTVVIGARDDSGAGALFGSAYRFERNRGGADSWGEAQKLTASDAATGDRFGQSISISGDTIVVGAHTEDAGGPDAGAVYIFATSAELDWHEIAKPVATDAAAGDQFGAASSISGDTIVVGAQRDDDAGSESGSAYVFERNVGGEDDWGQVKKLTAADAAAGDLFGAAVSISVDTVVVGAYLDDDAGESSGSVYVFERNAGGADNWGQVKKLTAPDAAAGDQFGVSVSISGDTIVVGAHVEDSVAPDSGSVYVFERNEGGADNWGEVKKLIASDAATDDLFGFSVSISGDTVVVGAFAEDSVAADSGSAYVFERNEGGADNWGQVKKLIASDAGAGDFFGAAVSISGDAVVVGANSNDDAGADSGSAYVFERNAGGEDNWGEVQELTASDAGGGGFFGISVSISVDTVVIGARDDSGAGALFGSAYRFERNRGGADSWGEAQKLTASDAATGDRFGQSISISGDTIVVGAHTEDAGGPDAGAAYIIPEPAQGLMLAAGLALLGGLDRLRRRERFGTDS